MQSKTHQADGAQPDRAVSPVIGVILMVAITVILAAVIGAFVLGLGQESSAGPTAAFDLTETGDDVEVELIAEERLDTWGAACHGPPDDLDQNASPLASTVVEDCDEDNVTVVGEHDGEEALLVG